MSNYRHRAGTKGTHYAGYTLCLTIDIGLVPKVNTMQAYSTWRTIVFSMPGRRMKVDAFCGDVTLSRA